MKRISKSQWENCPNCDNSGSIASHCCGGDEDICQRNCPDIEQCQFCYENPKSVFNQRQLEKIPYKKIIKNIIGNKI